MANTTIKAYAKRSPFLVSSYRAVRIIWPGFKCGLKTVRYSFSPPPTVRFVIFAQGRTGSTLLCRTLNTHPQITCEDEILGPQRAFTKRFIENAAKDSGDQCFGFHVKIYHLTASQRIRDVHEWLADVQARGWKIIYLRRENLLRHVVSNVFAESSGAYHYGHGDTKERPDRILLPAQRVREGIAGRRRHLAAERAALEGLEYLELVYEQDLERPETQEKTFKRIQDYLGVDNYALHTTTSKSVTKPLDELIYNYEEVQKVLSETGDEGFLHI